MAYHKRYYRYRSRKKTSNQTLLLWVAVLIVILPASLATQVSKTTLALVFAIALGLVLIVIGVLVLMKYRRSLAQRSAMRTLTLTNVDLMTGIEFEQYVAEVLRTRGFKVRDTAVTNDFGVDLIARRNDTTYAIQIKRYKAGLDQAPIREAVAGMAHYKCNKSMVVTNSYFTQSAKTLALSNACELIDRDTFAQWIVEFKNSGA